MSEAIVTAVTSYPLVSLKKIAQPILRPIDVVPGNSYRTMGVKWWGEGAYERETIDGSQTAAKTLSIIRTGDLVINKIWVRHGSTAVATEDVDGCAVSGEFPTFALDRDKVIPQWMSWLTKTEQFWNKCASLSQGTSGKNRIKPELFLTIEIPLPSIVEQRRIVARIEELAANVEEVRGLRSEALYESDILFVTALKQIRNECLENKFDIDTLGNITQVTSGGTPKREVFSYWNGCIPWVKTGELLDSDIDTAEEFITEEGLQNSSAKLFPPETILIALYGQGQTRGRTGRLVVEAATNQACCAILPQVEILDSRFIQYWLRSLYFEMRERYRDGAQPNWNGQMIKEITIVIPPIPEQRRIVAYLDDLQTKVDGLKQLQAETEAELNALLPSILDKAFKGEL